jgi:hypothetical protein
LSFKIYSLKDISNFRYSNKKNITLVRMTLRDEINKNKPKLCKGPDKGKLVNKLYCILLTTLELLDYISLEKKQT